MIDVQEMTDEEISRAIDSLQDSSVRQKLEEQESKLLAFTYDSELREELHDEAIRRFIETGNK